MLLTPDVEEGGGMIHRPDGHHALQLPSIVEIFPNRKKIQKPKLQSTASVSWRLSPCALDDASDEYAHTLFDGYSIVVPDLDANDGRDSNDGASDDCGSRDGASNFLSTCLHYYTGISIHTLAAQSPRSGNCSKFEKKSKP